MAAIINVRALVVSRDMSYIFDVPFVYGESVSNIYALHYQTWFVVGCPHTSNEYVFDEYAFNQCVLELSQTLS